MCGPCAPGWTNAGWSGCTDNDECREDTTNTCGAGGDCENIDGSYQCNCLPGYTLAGPQECIEDDQCEGNPCAAVGGHCINLRTEFYCLQSDSLSLTGSPLEQNIELPSNGAHTISLRYLVYLCICE